MHIQPATKKNLDEVRELHLSAFDDSEGEMVAKLATELLSETTTPRTISLVAEIEGAVVGSIAFSPVTIDGNDQCQGYILAPLAVKPAYQKRGVGSGLVEHGMQRLLVMGVNVVFVYGDPDYYGRFGFNAETADDYTPPYDLQYPFGWQALVLNECRADKSPSRINCVRSLCDPKLW